MGRDYVSDFRKFVDETLGDGPFDAQVAAEEIVYKLNQVDPDLLSGFLMLHAAKLAKDVIVASTASRKAHERTTAKPKKFFNDAKLAEIRNDTSQLKTWLETELTTVEGEKKRLGDMNGGQVIYASRQIGTRANQLLMTSMFLKKIGEKVGTRKVKEVYTEQQLVTMWVGLNGPR
jgi:hypothetical protein